MVLQAYRRGRQLPGFVLGGVVVVTALAGCGQSPSKNVSASPTQSTSSKTLVEGAKQYAGKANLKKWETLANSHPTSWIDQVQAGRAGYANQSPQTAIRYYKAAIKIDPQKGLAYNNLGNVYNRLLRQYSKAETYYAKSTKVDPTYDYGWYNYSDIEIQLGHKSQAVSIAKQSLAVLPASDPLRPYLKKIASGKG